MKRILVPCDFSVQAKNAFALALDIARINMAEVIVLRVMERHLDYEAVSPDLSTYVSVEATDKREQHAREEFEKMKAAHSTSVACRMAIVKGAVTDSILEFIDKEDISLIVMGTKGASGLQEVLIGSNTEKIVRFSKVPVIAVPQAVMLTDIKHIVLPSVLELNQADFIKQVKELQHLLNAVLWILVIVDRSSGRSQNEIRKQMEDFVSHYHLTNCVLKIREDESIEKGIINFTSQVNADMIAMATHSRRGLAHLFSGSITENLVNRVSCPIWTYTIRK
ncbi:universal stress protein [soil metagenome]